MSCEQLRGFSGKDNNRHAHVGLVVKTLLVLLYRDRLLALFGKRVQPELLLLVQTVSDFENAFPCDAYVATMRNCSQHLLES